MEPTVEDDLAFLTLEDDDDSEIQVEKENHPTGISFELCFVGRFLTTSVIHFQSLRTTLANLWRPLGGIAILELGNNRYLFRFYRAVDMDRMEEGGPWNFNSHLLILHRLKEGEVPLDVPLYISPFWILVHDVPHGYMSEGVANNWELSLEILYSTIQRQFQ
ncbi:hypothetical protein F3Y22_tig00111410pilonHSYRG00064 [Hibiscus syriacus]|uniref:DUF4283 domain-containing protein n=1 Tax=Hibiscus syriacus TaxID=106335 RepID=A0A6A2XS50_HIBSY|nr:hypothetical protein F3Y22_tig00111410pilonHSYRG00064 [Hibiscus syriacus]